MSGTILDGFSSIVLRTHIIEPFYRNDREDKTFYTIESLKREKPYIFKKKLVPLKIFDKYLMEDLSQEFHTKVYETLKNDERHKEGLRYYSMLPLLNYANILIFPDEDDFKEINLMKLSLRRIHIGFLPEVKKFELNFVYFKDVKDFEKTNFIILNMNILDAGMDMYAYENNDPFWNDVFIKHRQLFL